jgi:hypothetical protein
MIDIQRSLSPLAQPFLSASPTNPNGQPQQVQQQQQTTLLLKKRYHEPSQHEQHFPDQPKKKLKSTLTQEPEPQHDGFHTDFTVFGKFLFFFLFFSNF